MDITLEEIAKKITSSDRILVLSHNFPDGDTLGSAAALCHALSKLRKQFVFRCDQEISSKFLDLFEDLEDTIYQGKYPFEPELVISVDVADIDLLGSYAQEYAEKIDICIDHHGANKKFGKYVYVDAKAAATCEIIFSLLPLLGVKIDPLMAKALFTGITTDTGCFRYQNTTSRTMRIAADLMEFGVDAAEVNFKLFEIKSRKRLDLEKAILDGMEFFYGGKVALIVLSLDIIAKTGAKEEDLDGISALPRTIEGVSVGITLREREQGVYKISLRTNHGANASDICKVFGGGGHPGAAGCTLKNSLEEAKAMLVDESIKYLEKL